MKSKWGFGLVDVAVVAAILGLLLVITSQYCTEQQLWKGWYMVSCYPSHCLYVLGVYP